jgi:hypothetical protein
MAGPDEHAVRQACDDIARTGGRAHPMAGDPATAEGCDRVARTAAARFGVIDSWIEAGGQEASLAHVAQALVRQIGERTEPAALVGFGRRVGAAAMAELKQARGKVAATMIRLPKDWRHDSPAQAAAEAALHAVSRPMGHMVVATHGKRLTAATEARKHPGVMVGLGLLAVAGLAAWLNRDRIARTAAAARPTVARAVRPVVIQAVKRRPLQAARLAARHPRQALKLVRALR